MNSGNRIPPWALEFQDILTEHLVTPDGGLSSDEVQQRLQKFGFNNLGTEKKTSKVLRLLSQLKSPVVIILLVATAISFSLGEMVDAIAILTIVVINSLIGFFQEVKAEAAVENWSVSQSKRHMFEVFGPNS